MGLKITTSVLEALNTTVRANFFAAVEKVPVWHPRVASMVQSGGKGNTYPLIASPGQVREWVGDRVLNALQLGSYQIFNKPYELTFGIDRDDLEDDSTGMLTMSTQSVAEKFARHPDRMIAQIISDNPTGLDGVALFSATHPRNPVKPVTGENFANLFTAKPLNAANLAAVRAAMMTIPGPDGDILAIDPRVIIVPPELEVTARQIAFSAFVPSAAGTATQSNVMQGMYEVLVIPQLSAQSNGATTWYLADLSAADKPFIMQPRRPLSLVTMFNPADPEVFKRKEYIWGGDVRYGFGPGSPYRIAKVLAA